MTVGELKEILEDYDENQEVCIGMYQIYGSNFTYDINDIEVNDLDSFYGDNKENVVMLIEGEQSGTISK